MAKVPTLPTQPAAASQSKTGRGVWEIRGIEPLPLPRRICEADSEEAAIQQYRDKLQIRRFDLKLEVKRVL